MFIFTSIWKVHQLVEHEGLIVPVDRVCSDYKAHLSFIDYGSDHEILKRLQVPFNLRRASYIYTVIWRTPAFGWVKANSDAFSKGNPGEASCGQCFVMVTILSWVGFLLLWVPPQVQNLFY